MILCVDGPLKIGIFFLPDKWTGVVSTARITHATPAASYAHVAHRDWENDAVLAALNITGGCKDIAAQLIEDNKDIHVSELNKLSNSHKIQ